MDVVFLFRRKEKKTKKKEKEKEFPYGEHEGNRHVLVENSVLIT